MLRLQAPLPDRYTLASPDELDDRIAAAKAALGDRLLILGHHYQRHEVIRWADLRGDSFKLAPLRGRQRPGRPTSCSAACTSWPSRPTCSPATTSGSILPDLNAGCSMADMADIDQVEECWDELAGVTDIDRVVPITYMNSSAALKAFVGEHGGAVCTSSNARAVLEWALERAGRQGAVLPRPAPRPQHRLRHGLRRGRHAGLEPAPRARRPRGARREGRHVPALEGALLRAPAVPARARRRVPRRAPRRRGDRAPRVPRTRSSSSPTSVGSTERILEWVDAAPAGRGHRRRHRDPHGAAAWPTSTPTRRSCRSTR